MNSKFRITLDMDLEQVAPEMLGQDDVEQAVAALFVKQTLGGARAYARDNLRAVQRDPNLDQDVKILKIGENLRKIMFTLMAEANIKVEALEADVVIEKELPFEKLYSKVA